MKPKVVVVGSSNTDMIVKVPHLPSPGETVLGGEFHIVNGGKGANQAIAASRAGGEVVFLACIGNDSFGKNSMRVYEKEGIDISMIKIDDTKPSGVAMINVAESGENSISVAPGANSRLLPSDIENRKSVIKSADIVLLQLEIPMETVYYTIRIAHDYDIPIILNPAPAQELDPDILKLITFITPNEKEARTITSLIDANIEDSELIGELNKMGFREAIITLGKNGALFMHDGQLNYVEGRKVKVVDTTAAGDTFNGYLAVALANKEPLNSAITMANDAAALSVTRLGASTSIPYLNEILVSDK